MLANQDVFRLIVSSQSHLKVTRMRKMDILGMQMMQITLGRELKALNVMNNSKLWIT